MNSATGQGLFVVGASRIRVKNVFPFSLSIGKKIVDFFKGQMETKSFPVC